MDVSLSNVLKGVRTYFQGLPSNDTHPPPSPTNPYNLNPAFRNKGEDKVENVVANTGKITSNVVNVDAKSIENGVDQVDYSGRTIYNFDDKKVCQSLSPASRDDVDKNFAPTSDSSKVIQNFSSWSRPEIWQSSYHVRLKSDEPIRGTEPATSEHPPVTPGPIDGQTDRQSSGDSNTDGQCDRDVRTGGNEPIESATCDKTHAETTNNKEATEKDNSEIDESVKGDRSDGNDRQIDCKNAPELVTHAKIEANQSTNANNNNPTNEVVNNQRSDSTSISAPSQCDGHRTPTFGTEPMAGSRNQTMEHVNYSRPASRELSTMRPPSTESRLYDMRPPSQNAHFDSRGPTPELRHFDARTVNLDARGLERVNTPNFDGSRPLSRASGGALSRPTSRPSSASLYGPTNERPGVSSRPSSRPLAGPSTEALLAPMSELSNWPSSRPLAGPSTEAPFAPMSELSNRPSSRPLTGPSTEALLAPMSELSSRPSSRPLTAPSTEAPFASMSELSNRPSSRPSSRLSDRTTNSDLRNPTGSIDARVSASHEPNFPVYGPKLAVEPVPRGAFKTETFVDTAGFPGNISRPGERQITGGDSHRMLVQNHTQIRGFYADPKMEHTDQRLSHEVRMTNLRMVDSRTDHRVGNQDVPNDTRVFNQTMGVNADVTGPRRTNQDVRLNPDVKMFNQSNYDVRTTLKDTPNSTNREFRAGNKDSRVNQDRENQSSGQNQDVRMANTRQSGQISGQFHMPSNSHASNHDVRMANQELPASNQYYRTSNQDVRVLNKGVRQSNQDARVSDVRTSSHQNRIPSGMLPFNGGTHQQIPNHNVTLNVKTPTYDIRVPNLNSNVNVNPNPNLNHQDRFASGANSKFTNEPLLRYPTQFHVRSGSGSGSGSFSSSGSASGNASFSAADSGSGSASFSASVSASGSTSGSGSGTASGSASGNTTESRFAAYESKSHAKDALPRIEMKAFSSFASNHYIYKTDTSSNKYPEFNSVERYDTKTNKHEAKPFYPYTQASKYPNTYPSVTYSNSSNTNPSYVNATYAENVTSFKPEPIPVPDGRNSSTNSRYDKYQTYLPNSYPNVPNSSVASYELKDPFQDNFVPSSLTAAKAGSFNRPVQTKVDDKLKDSKVFGNVRQNALSSVMNQTNQTYPNYSVHGNQSNQMNQANQANQANQMNQANQASQMNQVNQRNQRNQTNQATNQAANQLRQPTLQYQTNISSSGLLYENKASNERYTRRTDLKYPSNYVQNYPTKNYPSQYTTTHKYKNYYPDNASHASGGSNSSGSALNPINLDTQTNYANVKNYNNYERVSSQTMQHAASHNPNTGAKTFDYHVANPFYEKRDDQRAGEQHAARVGTVANSSSSNMLQYRKVKRESPLDLSVKTVRTPADSTADDDVQIIETNRNVSVPKIDFAPNITRFDRNQNDENFGLNQTVQSASNHVNYTDGRDRSNATVPGNTSVNEDASIPRKREVINESTHHVPKVDNLQQLFDRQIEQRLASYPHAQSRNDAAFAWTNQPIISNVSATSQTPRNSQPTTNSLDHPLEQLGRIHAPSVASVATYATQSCNKFDQMFHERLYQRNNAATMPGVPNHAIVSNHQKMTPKNVSPEQIQQLRAQKERLEMEKQQLQQQVHTKMMQQSIHYPNQWRASNVGARTNNQLSYGTPNPIKQETYDAVNYGERYEQSKQDRHANQWLSRVAANPSNGNAHREFDHNVNESTNQRFIVDFVKSEPDWPSARKLDANVSQPKPMNPLRNVQINKGVDKHTIDLMRQNLTNKRLSFETNFIKKETDDCGQNRACDSKYLTLNDIDGLAANLAARIRTKAELKHVDLNIIGGDQIKREDGMGDADESVVCTDDKHKSSSEASVFDFRESDSETEIDGLTALRRKSLTKGPPGPSIVDVLNKQLDVNVKEEPEESNEIFFAATCDKFMEQLRSGAPKRRGRKRKNTFLIENAELIDGVQNDDNKSDGFVKIENDSDSDGPLILKKNKKIRAGKVNKINESDDTDTEDPVVVRKRPERTGAKIKLESTSGESSDNDEEPASDDDEKETERDASPRRCRTVAEYRLRQRKVKDGDDSSTGTTPEKKTLKKSSPKKKVSEKKLQRPTFGDGSEFRLGWEEEVYRYKQSIRMPEQLINVVRPSRLSSSLPDLDPCPSPASTVTDNETKTDPTHRKTFLQNMFFNVNKVKRELLCDSDVDSNSSTLTTQNNDDEMSTKTRKERMIDILAERFGAISRQKRTKKDAKDEVKDAEMLEKPTTDLLATPSLGIGVDEKSTNPAGTSAYLGFFRKETVNSFRDAFEKTCGEFNPILCKSRTRRETRIIKQRATIREVFGEDRPASAPPLIIEDTKVMVKGDKSGKDGKEEKERATVKQEKDGKCVEKKKPKINLTPHKINLRSSIVLRGNRNNLKSQRLVKRHGRSMIVQPDMRKSLKSPKKTMSLSKSSEKMANSLKNVQVRLRREDIVKIDALNRLNKSKNNKNNDKENSRENKDDESMDNSVDNMSIKSATTNVSNAEEFPRKKLRRKFSSGFDYLRKKKKCKKDGDVVDGEKSKKRSSETIKWKRTACAESVQDIQKEIKGWVLNKGVGETHLHRAARLGYAGVLTYCLDEMNMPPSPKDNAGYTPLHEACSRGNLEVAKLLLLYGANVHESAQGGMRPLHEAVENGYVEVVRLLLSYGADPLLATYAGHTPVSLANDDETKALLENYLADIQGKNAPLWQFCGPCQFFDEMEEESGYDALADAPIAGKEELSEIQTDDDMLIESSTLMLPNLYALRDTAANERWVLLQDLMFILKVKSKDALLRLISTNATTGHKHLVRELKMVEFLEQANCCSIISAGERVNIRASKISLVKYTDKVKDLLGVEAITIPTGS